MWRASAHAWTGAVHAAARRRAAAAASTCSCRQAHLTTIGDQQSTLTLSLRRTAVSSAPTSAATRSAAASAHVADGEEPIENDDLFAGFAAKSLKAVEPEPEPDTKPKRNDRSDNAGDLDEAVEVKPKRRAKKAAVEDKDDAPAKPKKQRASKTTTIQLVDLPDQGYGADGNALPPIDKEGRVAPRKGGKKQPTAEQTEMWQLAPRAGEVGPDGQYWPELAQLVLVNMAKFPDCILLTRVGGFYELYFEQAAQMSSLLGLKLSTRWWGGRNVKMAGFPVHMLEKYLKTMVIDQRTLVAICDEVKIVEDEEGNRMMTRQPTTDALKSVALLTNIKSNTKIDRRVTRVVSPGTLIDEPFLDPFISNWVLSISRVDTAYGLAWLDVSTADFGTTVCDDAHSMRDEVARLCPIEIVLEPGQFTESNDRKTGAFVIKKADLLWDALDASQVHVSFSPAETDGMTTVTPDKTIAEAAEEQAVANLTRHIQSRLLDVPNVERLTTTDSRDNKASRRVRNDVMTIDASTLSALEITTTQRRDDANFTAQSGAKGSLLSHVCRTVTKGGARMLAQWLTSPSTSLPLIHRRQSLVQLLIAYAHVNEDVRVHLRRKAGDINRALQRVLTRRNDVQDLLEVRDFVRMCGELKGILGREIELQERDADADNVEGFAQLRMVVGGFEECDALGERLGESIDEAVIARRIQAQQDLEREMEARLEGERADVDAGQRASKSVSEIGKKKGSRTPFWSRAHDHLIRPSTSKPLLKMTKEHTRLRRQAEQLQDELADKYDREITLTFTLGQGYVVYLPNTQKKTKTVAMMSKVMNMSQKSKTTHSFFNTDVSSLGHRIAKLVEDMQQHERMELERLRLEVLDEMPALRRNAAAIHELDVLAGFATLARELNLVRPTVHDGDELSIVAGRHLGVERSLQQEGQQHRVSGEVVLSDAGSVNARPFTPNDVRMHSASRLHFITGPNMGGKSTLLRMVAITTILAQVGSFVPAKHCSLSVVDQIFSRIGAHDAIHSDRSTFMVEMLEVAQFLRRSTRQSLILCDEVGRGTDAATGAALAYATARHLLEQVRCKCLFATHLHDVADMLHGMPGIEYFCTDLEETEPGLNRTSHGLTIARLANIPDEVLAHAAQTMQTFEDVRLRVQVPTRGDDV